MDNLKYSVVETGTDAKGGKVYLFFGSAQPGDKPGYWVENHGTDFISEYVGKKEAYRIFKKQTAVVKTTVEQKPKISSNKVESISGHDPKNGLVTMDVEDNGFRVKAERTAYNEFHATKTEAVAAYNFHINNSHRQ